MGGELPDGPSFDKVPHGGVPRRETPIPPKERQQRIRNLLTDTINAFEQNSAVQEKDYSGEKYYEVQSGSETITLNPGYKTPFGREVSLSRQFTELKDGEPVIQYQQVHFIVRKRLWGLRKPDVSVSANSQTRGFRSVKLPGPGGSTVEFPEPEDFIKSSKTYSSIHPLKEELPEIEAFTHGILDRLKPKPPSETPSPNPPSQATPRSNGRP